MSLNVFITGATGGIGSGLARVYAAKGATLGLVAHHQDALDRLIASLPGTGHKGYVADVTDRDGIIETAHRCLTGVSIPLMLLISHYRLLIFF